MWSFRPAPTSALVCLAIALASRVAPAAPLHLGAVHALRVVDSDGHELSGSLSQPAFSPDGQSLYFALEVAGTTNLWQARPVTQSAAEGRFPVWQAQPVTHLAAPNYAEQPRPLPNGFVLCTSNATNPPGAPPTASQIVRLDPRAGTLESLTHDEFRNRDASLAPDGGTLAFTSLRTGFESVYIMRYVAPGSPLQAPHRIVLRARRPVWEPSGALLFDSLRPLSRGLYRVTAPGDLASMPHLLVQMDGDSAVTSDGTGLALAAMIGGSSQLYTLAPDGSGMTATPGTTGAAHPVFSPDGASLAFDASFGATAQHERQIWLAGIQREAAVAQLGALRPASQGAYAVIGSVQGDGCVATLEFQRSDGPWTPIPVAPPPVTDAPIAIWTPPTPTGSFSLRLTVTAPDGTVVRDQLRAQLPLGSVGPAAPPLAEPAAQSDSWSAPGPAPSPIPAANALPVPAPTPRPAVPLVVQPAPSPSAPGRIPLAPSLPAGSRIGSWRGGFAGAPPATTNPVFPVLPALPAPAPARAGTRAGSRFPAARVLPILPPPAPWQGTTQFKPHGIRTVPPVRIAVGALQPTAVDSASRLLSRQLPGYDAGQLNVTGTLASLHVGQSCMVIAWVKNRSPRLWDAAPQTPGGAVRLVARWIDYRSGTRRKWSYQWIRMALPPRGVARWAFALTPPPQRGRYKLIYGLVRVDRGFSPPPANAPQDRWPGEFAAIAFAVDVR